MIKNYNETNNLTCTNELSKINNNEVYEVVENKGVLKDVAELLYLSAQLVNSTSELIQEIKKSFSQTQ